MNKEQVLKIVDRLFHIYASDHRKDAREDALCIIEQLTIEHVVISEMRTSKEINKLIELINKIENEQNNKCVDMKLRDIVNSSFFRLKKAFNKQSI